MKLQHHYQKVSKKKEEAKLLLASRGTESNREASCKRTIALLWLRPPTPLPGSRRLAR